jgi:hypothetical protein
MADTNVTIMEPAGSAALATGISNLLVAVVAAHKAGGGTTVEIGADLAAVVAALGPALSSAGLIGAELTAEPIGVAQAFADGAFKAIRTITGK